MAQKRGKRTAKKKTAPRRTTGRAKAKAGARPGQGGAETSDKVAQLQRLIAVMVEAGAVEVEMEAAGTKLRVRLKEEVPPVAYATPPVIVPQSGHGSGGAISPAHGGEAATPVEAQPGTEVFKSPMLGTFYRASSPDTEPFAEIGDRLGPDSTLCIIEAMKVMNEIKAERDLEIVDILVQNGDPVEYGQPLFVIKV